jgi:hypothetical protein
VGVAGAEGGDFDRELGSGGAEATCSLGAGGFMGAGGDDFDKKPNPAIAK